MPIRILASDVVSKIAAGEVVERPASVVKELVENALDAGASQVTVEVDGGGTRLIRVSDNGSGIARAEVELAFERHATSKISTETDIEAIASLGFRGEALPTIASVAEVDVLTSHQDESVGTLLKIDGGRVISKSRQGCPRGTTVTVCNLFHNVPARLKFLKSNTTESGHISQMVTQLSLAFPEVKFTLVMNGRTSVRTAGNGNLRDVLAEVYGLETAQSMLAVDCLGSGISGFVSPSSVSRSNRNYISFFINRRWVQSRTLTYAVEEAYQGMLMTGKHPVSVLNISLPPDSIDVNVHPTKREIKLRNEREVFLAVQKSVRETLIGYSPVTGMKSPPPSFTAAPIPTPIPLAFREGLRPDTSPVTSLHQTEAAELPPDKLPIMRVIGQFRNSYIIAEGPDGLYLVDQHAAHERVLFERITKAGESQAIQQQGLLEPVSIELNAYQSELVNAESVLLAESGFSLEPFGERACLLRAVPAFLDQHKIKPVILEILELLEQGQRSQWRERIAASLACHGAVRAGQPLAPEEMGELLRQLEETTLSRTCPHGRPTVIRLDMSYLEKGFGRH